MSQDFLNWNELLEFSKNIVENDFFNSKKIIWDTSISMKERVKWLIELKNNLFDKLKENWYSWILSDNFFVDWSIKISEKELLENEDGLLETIIPFVYKNWSEYIFRNADYYFLFDSLNIEWINEFWSINDFKIENIDIDKFILDIKEYYSSINNAIHDITNKSFNWEIDILYRKILLWLIDARINIIAFLENIAEIITDNNFLNSEYSWDLVFDRNRVKKIKDFYSKDNKVLHLINFDNLKAKLNKLQDIKIVDSLVYELWKNWDYYTKLLLWDTTIINELNPKASDDFPFEKLTESIGYLFEVIKKYSDNKYVDSWVEREDIHLANKIIRLYREENDPLVMIKTALNAYIWIIEDWFNSKVDNLDIFSVNYWGSTIWAYIKSVIELLSDNFWIWINNWNVVYSKYDLKNQNKWLKFSEYPSSSEIKRVISIYKLKFFSIIDNNYDKLSKINKIEKENWWLWEKWKNYVLIFDDNAQSWTTLRDLKVMLNKEGDFDYVKTYACRINPQLWKLSQSYSQDEKLELFSWAWVVSKRSPLKFLKWTRYNESLSRVIWRRIFKEKNNK